MVPSSATCPQTPSAAVLYMWETKFHTHTHQQFQASKFNLNLWSRGNEGFHNLFPLPVNRVVELNVLRCWSHSTHTTAEKRARTFLDNFKPHLQRLRRGLKGNIKVGLIYLRTVSHSVLCCDITHPLIAS